MAPEQRAFSNHITPANQPCVIAKSHVPEFIQILREIDLFDGQSLFVAINPSHRQKHTPPPATGVRCIDDTVSSVLSPLKTPGRGEKLEK